MKNTRRLSIFAILLTISALLVACTKTETKTERMTIPYETTRQNDSDMWEGEEKVIEEGISGEKEITYKLIYSNGSDSPPERENISEKIIKQPKNSTVKVGQKMRATGKNFVVNEVEFKLVGIKRVNSTRYGTAAGLNHSTGNGDYLELKFHVKNLSEDSREVPDIALRQGGTFYFAPTMAFASLQGDEEKEFMVPIRLKYSQSVNSNKWVNTSVTGPGDLILAGDQRISEGDGLWAAIPKYELSRNLTDFWVGPFYK